MRCQRDSRLKRERFKLAILRAEGKKVERNFFLGSCGFGLSVISQLVRIERLAVVRRENRN